MGSMFGNWKGGHALHSQAPIDMEFAELILKSGVSFAQKLDFGSLMVPDHKSYYYE